MREEASPRLGSSGLEWMPETGAKLIRIMCAQNLLLRYLKTVLKHLMSRSYDNGDTIDKSPCIVIPSS